MTTETNQIPINMQDVDVVRSVPEGLSDLDAKLYIAAMSRIRTENSIRMLEEKATSEKGEKNASRKG